MIDKDERLLQQFFSEAANQKIEDNGFTERVMQSLPVASQRSWLSSFSCLWTWFCISEELLKQAFVFIYHIHSVLNTLLISPYLLTGVTSPCRP